MNDKTGLALAAMIGMAAMHQQDMVPEQTRRRRKQSCRGPKQRAKRKPDSRAARKAKTRDRVRNKQRRK